MKKVAIVTLNGYFNYGNRLQNYALQEVVKGLGYEVETILHHELVPVKKETVLQKVGRKLNNLSIKNIKIKIDLLLNSGKYNQIQQSRISEFKKFSHEHIKETDFSIHSNSIPIDLGDRYDYFVAGSDQIWNPFFQYHESVESAIEYLMFAPKEKRLSYAASFGISEIPVQFRERVKNGLRGMSSILVREAAGVEIVRNIANREATLVLDPTMLLTKNQWLSIASSHKNKPKKKYLLTYFLGEKSSQTMQYINKFAQECDLEIIHLEDKNNTELYKAHPGHFIDYINDASIFCTDSFHGVVFSIILETPFIVFKREGSGPSMYSRIETLLGTFDLQFREIDRIANKKVFDLDFSKAHAILNEKRLESINVLKHSLTEK